MRLQRIGSLHQTITCFLILLPFLLTAGGIHNGFYLKIGPSLPLGNYKAGQVLPYTTSPGGGNYYYMPAKTGAVLEMGSSIYIGPAFIKKKMRVGIDYSFLELSFNSVDYLNTMDDPRYYYWYGFAGQKIGPVITVNPVDKLMFDFSYQMNAFIAINRHLNGSGYFNEWGVNLFQNEVSASVRYAALIISFQYNFGNINFNNIDFSNPDHLIDFKTFRILFGVKL
jgi:hypothetical protein